MKPIARWTIGNSTKHGYECLELSIKSFLNFYDCDIFVCYNCKKEKLPSSILKYNLIDQFNHLEDMPDPKGVSWKFYPPRLSLDTHEIVIDNDIIFKKRIEEIDLFFNSDITLMLEDDTRTYGKFLNFIPKEFKINSGIYGMPPNFDLRKYINFYAGGEWEKNALYENDKSETFDEQGLVALALIDYNKYIIIPKTTVTACSLQLKFGSAMHFMGLNRSEFHPPYRLYRSLDKKLYL